MITELAIKNHFKDLAFLDFSEKKKEKKTFLKNDGEYIYTYFLPFEVQIKFCLIKKKVLLCNSEV